MRSQALLRDADELRSFAGKLSQQVFGPLNVGCFIPLALIATLANIRKTIVVDIFSQCCREQISDARIPGMASL
jgi:hypothetical protein